MSVTSDHDSPRTRVLTVGSDPRGVRTARHQLRGFLTEAERELWLDVAELACTELVTNAVLHAHTDVTVTMSVDDQDDGASLRVEVSDASTDLPQQRSAGGQATTGRGMALVAALSAEHGVRSDGENGKTVWFVLRSAPVDPSAEDLLDAWDDGSWDLSDLPPEPVQPVDAPLTAAGGDHGQVHPPVPVLLEQLPPTLWLAAGEHHDTVLRELVLYLAGAETAGGGKVPGTAPGPDAVVDMAAADAARTLLSTAVSTAVRRAQEDGTARPALPGGHPGDLPWVPAPLSLRLLVPADVVASFAALQDALDLAERLATAGLLLARPGLPEIVAVRDWACEQVLAQHRGSPAAAWPGTDQERFAAAGQDDGPAGGPTGAAAGWDATSTVATHEAVVVADDSNRIVAVSTAMAGLVGWDRDDLVGRRIVTLIPHALREAHVAGFSRHLTTGTAHLLGLTLTLPVLHADGHELVCHVRIDQAATVRGRPLYLAVFSPAPDEA